MQTGKISYGEFATDPCRSIFSRIYTLFVPEPADNAAVNVTRIADPFVALTETPLPVEFDPQTLEVQVELAETRLGTIAEGDPTTIALDAAPAVAYRGRVRQVWPTADRQKATVEMRVEFLDRPPVLKPEMGARVTFHARAPATDGAAPAAKENGPSRP